MPLDHATPMTRPFDCDGAADAFYRVLFGRYPGLRRLFHGMPRQKLMLATALDIIRSRRLGDPELHAYLLMLGEKHRMMGILDMHMAAAFLAFTAALEAGDPHMPKAEMAEHLAKFRVLARHMGFTDEIYELSR